MIDNNYIRRLDRIPGSLTILLRIRQKVLKKNNVDQIDDIDRVGDKLTELQTLGLLEIHGGKVTLTRFGKKISELVEDMNSFLLGAAEFPS